VAEAHYSASILPLTGPSLALAGLNARARQAAEKIVPYVRAPDGLVPGKPLFFTKYQRPKQPGLKTEGDSTVLRTADRAEHETSHDIYAPATTSASPLGTQ
jgi:hypothetical protein